MRWITLTAVGPRVELGFRYDPRLVEAVRRVPGRRWDGGMRRWSIPRSTDALDVLVRSCAEQKDLLLNIDPALLTLVTVPLPPRRTAGPNGRIDPLDLVRARMIREGYSPRTRKNYLGHVRRFLAAVPGDPVELESDDVLRYLHEEAASGRSLSNYRQVLSALRYLFATVGRKALLQGVEQPRRERKLPVVLSREEVRAILKATTNRRYRLALALAYSSGLRVSEVVRLRAGDVDAAAASSTCGGERVGRTATHCSRAGCCACSTT